MRVLNHPTYPLGSSRTDTMAKLLVMKQSTVLQFEPSQLPPEAFSSPLAEIETLEDGYLFTIPQQILEIRCPRLAELLHAEAKDRVKEVIVESNKAAFSVVVKFIYTAAVDYLKDDDEVVTAIKAYKLTYPLKMKDARSVLRNRIQTFITHNSLFPEIIRKTPKLSKKSKLREFLRKHVYDFLRRAHDVGAVIAEDWTLAQAEQILSDATEYNLDNFIHDLQIPQLSQSKKSPRKAAAALREVVADQSRLVQASIKTEETKAKRARTSHEQARNETKALMRTTETIIPTLAAKRPSPPPQQQPEIATQTGRTSVKIMNLPDYIQLSVLFRVLMRCGELKAFRKDKNQTSAFVDFDTPGACAIAIAGSPYRIDGKFIDIRPSQPAAPSAPKNQNTDADRDRGFREPLRERNANEINVSEIRTNEIHANHITTEDTIGHVAIRNVTEDVASSVLRKALSYYGGFCYFTMRRERNCVYAGFWSKRAAAAAVRDSPHLIADIEVMVHRHRQPVAGS